MGEGPPILSSFGWADLSGDTLCPLPSLGILPVVEIIPAGSGHPFSRFPVKVILFCRKFLALAVKTPTSYSHFSWQVVETFPSYTVPDRVSKLGM